MRAVSMRQVCFWLTKISTCQAKPFTAIALIQSIYLCCECCKCAAGISGMASSEEVSVFLRKHWMIRGGKKKKLLSWRSFEKIVLLPWNTMMSTESGKVVLVDLVFWFWGGVGEGWQGGNLPGELSQVFILGMESPGIQWVEGRESAGFSGYPLMRRSSDRTPSSPHHIDKTLPVRLIQKVEGREYQCVPVPLTDVSLIRWGHSVISCGHKDISSSWYWSTCQLFTLAFTFEGRLKHAYATSHMLLPAHWLPLLCLH